MGRHSANASSGAPDEEPSPTGPVGPRESGVPDTIHPPVGSVHRRRVIAAIALTVVGLALLVFGFFSLTATDDPPATTSQETAATTTSQAATSATTPSTAASSSVSPSVSPDAAVLPVTVLNASPDLMPGLATRVAETLQTAGWPIAEVSNYDATVIAQTTAYFTPGNAAEEAAAQALVAQFPDIAGGAQPRFEGLSGSGLTVAAVGDWLP